MNQLRLWALPLYVAQSGPQPSLDVVDLRCTMDIRAFRPHATSLSQITVQQEGSQYVPTILVNTTITGVIWPNLLTYMMFYHILAAPFLLTTSMFKDKD
jgi:hypothetical protein